MKNQTLPVNRKTFNKNDIYFIAAVLLAALLIFGAWAFFNRESGTREGRISVNGVTVMSVDLGKDSVFSIPERPNIVFEVKDGAVAFITSDCPDKVCVHSGFMKHSGQLAACLPNDVVLSIIVTGKQTPDDPDVFT